MTLGEWAAYSAYNLRLQVWIVLRCVNGGRSERAMVHWMLHNGAVHPAEGRRDAPPPRVGCNGLLCALCIGE